jgi:hypothetical protein
MLCVRLHHRKEDYPMNDIIKKAKEYRNLVAIRANAHERSAEWHRHRGTQLGVSATALSALVSTAIFATVTSQLSLENPNSITIPQCGWYLLLYFVFVLLLILAPVLTGVQTYLNHPEQAKNHKVSWAGYYRLKQRLDLFLLRYSDVNAGGSREEALKELEDISKEIEMLCDNSITLTRRAYDHAKAELPEESVVSHEA